MTVTIKQHQEAVRKLSRLVQLNDAIVQQNQAIIPILDQIAGLSGAARNKLNEVLTAMGIDIADFDALLAALDTVRQAILTNLQLQQP